MRLENDVDFNFLYNEECEKIPLLFRFNRKRLKIAVIVMIVLFVAMLLLTTAFYSTQTTVEMPSAIPATTLGSTTHVSDYDYRYLVAVIVVALLVVLIGGWITLVKVLDNRAFKKATKLSNMIFLSERHRMEVEWQNWKMQNRDY